MGRIRDELTGGYREIARQMSSDHSEGGSVVNGMLDGALHALATASPTWIPAATAVSLRNSLSVPAPSDDLIALGETGFLLFQRPLAVTTLGGAGPDGLAPIQGLLWWSANLADDDSGLVPGDDPDLIVVHALSSYVTPAVPWSPGVWGNATLTDIGMFPLPLGQQITPPPVSRDDLAPALELLFSLGAAARQQRLLFEDADDCDRQGADGPSPRVLAVLMER